MGSAIKGVVLVFGGPMATGSVLAWSTCATVGPALAGAIAGLGAVGFILAAAALTGGE